MKKKTTICILLLIFAGGMVLAVTGVATDAELTVARFINPDGNRNRIMRLFTGIGESEGVIGIAALLLLLPMTRRRVGLPVAVTALLSWIVNTAVKYLIQRPRPAERLLEIGGYSFPSGHAMNNAALYVAVMLTVLRLCKTRLQRVLTVTVCIGVPMLIGVSRVYFNVHYLSDVVGGWCLGSVIAIICCSVCFRIADKKEGLLNHGSNKT